MLSHHRVDELKDIINSTKTHSILLDIRPELQYSKNHIRNTINIPPNLWRNKNPEEFIESLRSLKIHLLLRYLCFEPKHSTSLRHQIIDNVGLHIPSFTFIIFIENSMDSTKKEAEYVMDLLDKITDSNKLFTTLLHREGFNAERNLPRVDIKLFPKSYEQMGKSYEPLFHSLIPLKEHKEIKSNCKINTIISQSIFHGNVDNFLKFVENQSKESRDIIYNQTRDPRKFEKRWHTISTLFYIGFDPPIIPDSIKLIADASCSFGERYVYEKVEEEDDDTTKHKSKRAKIATKLGIKKTKKLKKKLQVDENITQHIYTFDNGYSFKWHVTLCNDLTQLSSLLNSVADFMEESCTLKNPFLACSDEFSILSLVFYFLVWRKWSIRRCFRYLYYTLGDSLLTYCQGDHFLDGLFCLLKKEAEVLPEKWPSVSYVSFLTFSLGQEPNLAGNVSVFKNPHKELKKKLFKAIDDGDKTTLLELVDKYSFLKVCRTSFKYDRAPDYTPLLYSLINDNCTIRCNKECLDALSSTEVLALSSLSGHDILYYAIELGSEFVTYFVNKGCLLHRCSIKLRMNPLQRAIKFQLPPEILQLLMNRCTVNHRDSYQRTPAIYVAEEYYSNDLKQKEKALLALVNHGADLFLQDIDKNTVSSIIATKTPKLISFVDQLINQEGTIRYTDYRSFAPQRDNINVEYFIDGENTYKAMRDALFLATKSVYVADWWLTPQTYLDRSSDNTTDWEKYRFDNILKDLATRGVIIRVMLWENVEQVEGIGSEYTHSYLESLHENILVVRHSSSFIAGLSHHQKLLIIDEYIAFVGGLDICAHRWDSKDHSSIPTNQYPGKDYFNPRYVSKHDDLTEYLEDYKHLTNRDIPRMGWHDIHFRVDGLAAFDVCINFVQRWNFIRENRKLAHYPALQHPAKDNIQQFSTQTSTCVPVQITRSVGEWSIGFKIREQSIFNAIKIAISKAEHYVYIETQFFISIQEQMEAQEDPTSLSDAIINRIRRAINSKTPFKVIIILPMYPECNPLEDTITRRIMYWQLHTIKYIENAVEELTQGNITGPSDYINFYSIANHGLINNIPIIEQIYVHAKLLITDSTIICGSANLNMRSLLGDRDSEICVVIESKELAEKMRMELWKEHLGDKEGNKLKGNCLKDFRRWDRVARKNSKYYKNVFGKTFPLGKGLNKFDVLDAENSYKKFWNRLSAIDRKQIYNKLELSIQGHLVKFPRYYLQEDIEDTQRFKHTMIDVLNPLTPLHFLRNIKEVTVFTFVEYLVQ